MILMIDNYDSFTYNLVQYFFELGEDVKVFRNDAISIDEIEKLNPDHIVISPGPKTPSEAGVSEDVIRYFAGKIPILGICLGHQAIGEVFGGKVIRARELVHGKARNILHDGKTIFSGINSPLIATRYHSLVISKENFPECLEISAVADDGEIMAVRHKTYRVEGVQFHPESILTESGKRILQNFIKVDTSRISVRVLLEKLINKIALTEQEASSVMSMIMSGEVSNSQIGALLAALRSKGETVDEITGFAKAMREKAEKIKLDEHDTFVDTCGTGGDAKHTFNISTTVAFVAAGAGVKIAKHGNKAISSSSGSADILQKLGVKIDVPLDKVKESISKIGIGFMFAPMYHKAMKYVAVPRRELGVRTVFNLLGPLSNPADTKYQIIGVYDKNLTEIIANVLGRLGSKHVFVVAADDGLDEITLTGRTKISEYKDGEVVTYMFDPKDYGFKYCSIEDMQVNNVNESEKIVLNILKGVKDSRRDIVVINAAAVFISAGLAKDFKDGIKLAEESIDTGNAYKKLLELVEYTNN